MLQREAVPTITRPSSPDKKNNKKSPLRFHQEKVKVNQTTPYMSVSPTIGITTEQKSNEFNKEQMEMFRSSVQGIVICYIIHTCSSQFTMHLHI